MKYNIGLRELLRICKTDAFQRKYKLAIMRYLFMKNSPF